MQFSFHVRMLVSAGIYLWPDEGSLLWTCSGFLMSLRNVALGHHLCLVVSVSSCQQFRWVMPPVVYCSQCHGVGGPGCHLCPLLLVVGEAFRSHGLHMHSVQSNNSHACLTLIMPMYAQVLCWSGMEERDGEKQQTCSLHVGRITDLCECGSVWAWELIAPE